MKRYFCILIFAFSYSVQSDELDCDNALTTIEINVCAGKTLEIAGTELETYISTAEEKYASERNVIEALQKSQLAWINYRKSYCDAIYEMWSGGTIRGFMFSRCMLQLTKECTHNIWSDYLTYMDSTPPLLPEPK
jgi:uncharacterized protein YecT (DUF1311 family)